MTEDQLQDICAGYLVSDQWRLSALAVAFLFVACGWMVATKSIFALVRNAVSWFPVSKWLK